MLKKGPVVFACGIILIIATFLAPIPGASGNPTPPPSSGPTTPTKCIKGGNLGSSGYGVNVQGTQTCGGRSGSKTQGKGSSGAPGQTEAGRKVSEYQQCLQRSLNGYDLAMPIACGKDPLINFPTAELVGFTNVEFATVAAARLVIPELEIEIGPYPKLNPWKSAIIGVNYWIYASGQTAVPETGTTVGAVSVHLSAKLTGLTVNTNANQVGSPILHCSGPGTPWRKGTPLSKKSPTCGHEYTKPTTAAIQATATWTVFWEINGETGTIQLGRTTTLTVPVKELQSVKR